MKVSDVRPGELFILDNSGQNKFGSNIFVWLDAGLYSFSAGGKDFDLYWRENEGADQIDECEIILIRIDKIVAREK